MTPTRAGLLATAASVALFACAPSVGAEEGACTGVLVQVGDTAPRCADQFDTGREALVSAGFSTVDKTPGFLCQIDARPTSCTVTPDTYWSYWRAERTPEGDWGPWTYSPVGYTESRPERGEAEGWVLGDGRTPPPALPADPGPLVHVSPAAPQDPGSPMATLATAGMVALGSVALGGVVRRRGRTA